MFNYVFAGDLLLGINQKYEAVKVHEVLDKDLDPGFWNYLQRKKLSPS